MTKEEIREQFRQIVKDAGGAAAWARAHHVTRQYVSDVLNDTREPGSLILATVGAIKETTYRPAPRTSPSEIDMDSRCGTTNRNACLMELDRAENDAALMAWVKRWRPAIRSLLSGLPL